MHDIKAIRDDPKAFDDALARRAARLPEPMAARLLEKDDLVRAAITAAQSRRADISAVSTEVAQAKRQGKDASALIEKSKALGQALADLEATETLRKESLRHDLSFVPNLPLLGVPEGASEIANREVEGWRYGAPRSDQTPPHEEIGARLGLLDAETAVAMSGQRFTMLTGVLARLERHLGAMMLDIAGEQGFTEVSPPLIVNPEAMFGTGQLPKFEDDLYGVCQGFTDVMPTQFLIPTAEVPLTNIVRDKIVELSQPLRYTALTPCFRAEAGAAGRDAAGLIRQHQFYKVELVTICKPEHSDAEHRRMLFAACMVLQALKLPYRVMELCCGDMGFTAQRTYDLEVWFPSQGKYREISSISRCGDFQARRMNARYRNEKGKPAFVHTLNGSGVAVGRCLAAIMENYWQDGKLMIPDILQDRMGGMKFVEASRG